MIVREESGKAESCQHLRDDVVVRHGQTGLDLRLCELWLIRRIPEHELPGCDHCGREGGEECGILLLREPVSGRVVQAGQDTGRCAHEQPGLRLPEVHPTVVSRLDPPVKSKPKYGQARLYGPYFIERILI